MLQELQLLYHLLEEVSGHVTLRTEIYVGTLKTQQINSIGVGKLDLLVPQELVLQMIILMEQDEVIYCSLSKCRAFCNRFQILKNFVLSYCTVAGNIKVM